jgi:hypothetical protein|tara:strand:+ start:2383 stop:2490 length:108 start_codon:yes stop_codon:yes gene_type:complete
VSILAGFIMGRDLLIEKGKSGWIEGVKNGANEAQV